jgi:hypothetical protein
MVVVGFFVGSDMGVSLMGNVERALLFRPMAGCATL